MPTSEPPDRWPLPALLVWLAAWAAYVALRAFQFPVAESFGVVAFVVFVWSMRRGATPVRRIVMALGFPASWLLVAGLLPLPPAWVWALALLLVLALYPWRAWRDAPLFPTPPGAFDGLREQVWLPPRAAILDAGSGAGDGLLALQRAYPDARLTGVERSWPLVWLARLRYPNLAQIRQGDLWAEDWSAYDLVYLFQRPESMARAAAKAGAELRTGAWLASLEFEVPGWVPSLRWTCPDGRPLWLYQQPESVSPVTVSAEQRDRSGAA